MALGQGVGQRRRGSRLAETTAPRRLPGFAEEVGCGANVLLDRPEQEDEQRLREANRHERGVHLRGHDPPDGEAVSPCSVVFGQFLHARL